MRTFLNNSKRPGLEVWMLLPIGFTLRFGKRAKLGEGDILKVTSLSSFHLIFTTYLRLSVITIMDTAFPWCGVPSSCEVLPNPYYPNQIYTHPILAYFHNQLIPLFPIPFQHLNLEPTPVSQLTITHDQ